MAVDLRKAPRFRPFEHHIDDGFRVTVTVRLPPRLPVLR